MAVGIFLEQWTSGRFRRLEPAPGVFTFLVDCRDIKRTDREFVWIDDAAWIARYFHGTGEVHNFHKNVQLELDIPMEEYTISVATQAWTFDKSTWTLHRHHNIKNRKRHLEIALYRRKSSDYLVIVLQLGNRGDPHDMDDHRIANKVYIVREASLEEGPWIENVYAGLLYETHVGREAFLEGIHVSLRTHQVFNHLISTLTISTRSPAQMLVRNAMTPTLPNWPISPAWPTHPQTST